MTLLAHCEAHRAPRIHCEREVMPVLHLQLVRMCLATQRGYVLPVSNCGLSNTKRRWWVWTLAADRRIIADSQPKSVNLV